jgi:FkbM family methyltransferase
VRGLFRARDPFARLERVARDPRPPYHAQDGQDRLLHEEVFGDLRGGTFVDVGAHDGLTFSNTAFFEKALGWTGLCVEPLPESWERLRRARTAACVQGCVAAAPGTRAFRRIRGYSEMLSGLVETYEPRHLERLRREIAEHGGTEEVVQVPAFRLDDLLARHGIGSVDLLSVDVEGAEEEVLSSFDLRSVRPKVVCVENNYRAASLRGRLRRAGYRPFARVGADEVWLAKGVRPVR